VVVAVAVAAPVHHHRRGGPMHLALPCLKLNILTWAHRNNLSILAERSPQAERYGRKRTSTSTLNTLGSILVVDNDRGYCSVSVHSTVVSPNPTMTRFSASVSVTKVTTPVWSRGSNSSYLNVKLSGITFIARPSFCEVSLVREKNQSKALGSVSTFSNLS